MVNLELWFISSTGVSTKTPNNERFNATKRTVTKRPMTKRPMSQKVHILFEKKVRINRFYFKKIRNFSVKVPQS